MCEAGDLESDEVSATVEAWALTPAVEEVESAADEAVEVKAPSCFEDELTDREELGSASVEEACWACEDEDDDDDGAGAAEVD